MHLITEYARWDNIIIHLLQIIVSVRNYHRRITPVPELRLSYIFAAWMVTVNSSCLHCLLF